MTAEKQEKHITAGNMPARYPVDGTVPGQRNDPETAACGMENAAADPGHISERKKKVVRSYLITFFYGA